MFEVEWVNLYFEEEKSDNKIKAIYNTASLTYTGSINN